MLQGLFLQPAPKRFKQCSLAGEVLEQEQGQENADQKKVKSVLQNFCSFLALWLQALSWVYTSLRPLDNCPCAIAKLQDSKIGISSHIIFNFLVEWRKESFFCRRSRHSNPWLRLVNCPQKVPVTSARDTVKYRSFIGVSGFSKQCPISHQIIFYQQNP